MGCALEQPTLTFGSPASCFRENSNVRKRIVSSDQAIVRPGSGSHWMDLGQIATVEVTSEDPSFPLESALVSRKGPGWRAAQKR